MKLKPWDGAAPIDAVYQPEAPEAGELPVPVTKQEFVDLCFGDSTAAARLFEQCEWQRPEAVLESCGGYERLALQGGERPCRIIVLGNPDRGERFELLVDNGLDGDELEHTRAWIAEAFQDLVSPRFGPSMRAAGFVARKGDDGYCCVAPGGAARTDTGFDTDEAAFAAMAELVAPSAREGMGAVATPMIEVVFSTAGELSREFPHAVEMTRAGEPRALIPYERVEIHAAQPISPFLLEQLHTQFEDMSLRVLKEPSIEATVVAVDRAFTTSPAEDAYLQSLPAPEARLHELRRAWYRKHYGDECKMAMNRGYAYVGPLVGESKYHYYQLDLVNHQLVTHFKVPFPEHTPICLGKAYSITHTGGIRNTVQAVPMSVAQELARRINARRQGLGQQARQRLVQSQLDGSFVHVDSDLPIDVAEGADGYVHFTFDGEMVGYIYSEFARAPAPKIQPAAISRGLAERASKAGLQVSYGAGGFTVDRGDLELAAFEKLGWFEPPDLVGPHCDFIWQQKRETGYPAHKALEDL